jgi:hypothetical protein
VCRRTGKWSQPACIRCTAAIYRSYLPAVFMPLCMCHLGGLDWCKSKQGSTFPDQPDAHVAGQMRVAAGSSNSSELRRHDVAV